MMMQSDAPSPRSTAMAVAGNGQFLDANSNATGKQFVISDVINVPGLNCGNL